MKKFLYIGVLILISISCVKDLDEDPRGVLSPAALFASPDGITLFTNNLGDQLANMVYNSSWHLVPYLGGDDITSRTGSNKQDWVEVDIFGASAGNVGLTSDWAGYFSTINSANAIISNIQFSTAEQSVTDDCLGQAYFYRALSYSFLTRIWGKVPLFDSYSTEINYNAIPAAVADIYALIVGDCQKAEELLPVTRDDCYMGAKPIQGAAKALLSQVYLTMTGWPIKEISNYALAAAKAKEVMDNATTYGYALEDIHDLWSWADNYTNTEVIFGMYYRNTAEGGWAGTMASPPADRPEEEGGWADYIAEISFFNKFPAGPRKDVTYQTTIKINNVDVPWDDASTVTQHPYFAKYTDDRDKFDWWGSRTQQIIRYAEVLLTYAEAKVMSTGVVDATAYDAINLVRNRAGLPDLSTGITNAEQFRDSVVAERGWEFAGGEPASRWFDLVRLERVAEAALERNPNELVLRHQPSESDYWMPIPSTDKALNPNLK